VAETLLKDEFEESSKRGQTSCVVRLLLCVVSVNLTKKLSSLIGLKCSPVKLVQNLRPGMTPGLISEG